MVFFNTVHIRCKVHTCVQSKLIFYGMITLQVISFTAIKQMFENTTSITLKRERPKGETLDYRTFSKVFFNGFSLILCGTYPGDIPLLS